MLNGVNHSILSQTSNVYADDSSGKTSLQSELVDVENFLLNRLFAEYELGAFTMHHLSAMEILPVSSIN